jgi:hypothetical protein
MTLAVIALSSAIAHPASAATFPSLTTIYVGSGVFDSGDGTDVGVATSLHCSNVSGQNAEIRVLILGASGSVEGSATLTAPHGFTVTFSTHAVESFFEISNLQTGSVLQGVVNVESTNSAVFCTAVVVDAGNATRSS